MDMATPIMLTVMGPILSESFPNGRAPAPNRRPERVMESDIAVMDVENSEVRRSSSGGMDRMHAWLYAWETDENTSILFL